MSNKTGAGSAKRTQSKTTFQVKPVWAAELAAIVLDELSRDYGDSCNYLEAAALVRGGNTFLALASIEQQNAGRDVSSPRQYWVHAQALAVVKKLTDPDVDRWEPTKAHWFRTEERCRKLNHKFVALSNRMFRGQKPVPYEKELVRFKEALVHALGVVPPEDDIAEEAYYGPGSTVSIRGREVFYVRKVEAKECVPQAIELAAQALLHDKAAWVHVGMDPVYSQNPSAREGFLRVMREQLTEHAVRHDRLMFIHKSMTSLRSIGAQPTCSGMLQLGVHSVVSPLLHAVGVDLTNQGWNQVLAKRGSTDWREPECFCTLDKSDASNLIARNLVTFAFPAAWAKLLNRIRTPGYEAPPEIGGGLFDYHMYAGMGNGTTFAVESLIFWAIAYATSEDASVPEFVAKKEFAVYGDDVALRRSHALRYQRFAKFLGFKFNAKKTFTTGPFRESCGADYYDGIPVRPATLDSETSAASTETIIGFHNTLADNVTFPLEGACRRIRQLYRANVYPLVPTDNQGNLGFRPMGVAHYSVVRNEAGVALLSVPWQRPRVYQLEVKPQMAALGKLDSWTQMAVALLKARQSRANQDQWSLPVRKVTHIRVRPELDLDRRDLAIMLRNQLAKLVVRKASPWWEAHRGTVNGR